MNVLLNGCSFLDSFHYREHFKELLGATVTNIAKPGSSNRRIIRTTVDYCELAKPDFIVIGLTFYDRQEGPFLVDAKPREGTWVSYNSQGLQGTFISNEDPVRDATYRQIDDYAKSRYRYDINNQYLDQLYLDIKLLTAWLTQQGIGYCIFNTCERHHTAQFDDPGIVPLDFIGNVFLAKNGCVHFEKDNELPLNARHYPGEDVILLVAHLVEYIQRNNLIDRPSVQMSLL
jgi:hypothetical protein